MPDATIVAGQLLVLFIFSFGLGSVAITAVVIERLWLQLLLTLLFVVASASLFQPGESAPDPFAAYGGPWAVFGIIDFAGLFAARLLLAWKKPWHALFRQWLVSGSWNAQTVAAPTHEDLYKRWFVTVAAATGNVAGILISEPKAWAIIHTAISPSRLFFTVLLTVMSVTLVGPGEEFVLGAAFRAEQDSGEEAGHSHFERLLQNLSSWRALGRIFLVFAAWFALNIMHSCMDESVNDTNVKTSTEILLSVVPSGLISYYWCAALQRGVKDVSNIASRAVMVAACLLFLPGHLFAALFALHADIGANFAHAVTHYGLAGTLALAGLRSAIYLALAVLLAGLAAFTTYTLPAGFGGAMLDANNTRRKRSAFLIITQVIGAVALAQFLIFACGSWLAQHLVGLPITDREFLTSLLFLVGTLGWGLGLLFSNFPQILEGAHARSAAAPANDAIDRGRD